MMIYHYFSLVSGLVKDNAWVSYHTKETLKDRVFFNEPASPPDQCPRKASIHPCPPEKKWITPPVVIKKKG